MPPAACAAELAPARAAASSRRRRLRSSRRSSRARERSPHACSSRAGEEAHQSGEQRVEREVYYRMRGELKRKSAKTEKKECRHFLVFARRRSSPSLSQRALKRRKHKKKKPFPGFASFPRWPASRPCSLMPRTGTWVRQSGRKSEREEKREGERCLEFLSLLPLSRHHSTLNVPFPPSPNNRGRRPRPQGRTAEAERLPQSVPVRDAR